MTTIRTELERKLTERRARMAVLGMGYVGLPLAAVFAEAGFDVTGIDPDPRKIEALNKGESYIGDIPSSQVAALVKAGRDRGTVGTDLYLTLSLAPAARDQGLRVERRYERFVEDGDGPVSTEFAQGDLVRVVLRVTTPQARRYVAVVDALPAGFEAVEGFFRTTASDLARDASVSGDAAGSWWTRYQRGGFDHVEKHDDRVQLFATRLADGTHEFSYLVRATTTGTFTAAGPAAELMYAPDVNGRAAATTVIVK